MIYPILIAAIIISYFIVYGSISDQKKAKKFFIVTAFLLIFLVCVLRKHTVGSDTPAYWRVYLETYDVSFWNFSYVYFEKAFTLLMKLCVLLDFPFELFLAVCYLIMLLPIAIFVYNFSNDPLVSVIIFICYMFFEFYMTGIRQAMAMSICLIGLTIFLCGKKFKYFWYYLFAIIAFFFHKGAIVALFLPLTVFSKKPIYFLIAMSILFLFMLIFRSSIMALIKDLSDKDTFNTGASEYFGLNLISLMVITAIFTLFYHIKNYNIVDNYAAVKECKKNEYVFINMMVIGVILMAFFGLERSARSSMFYLIAIMCVVPNFLESFNMKSAFIIKFGVIAFLVGYFLVNINTNNRFALLPYLFFWQ